jgi:hypothetical protein
VGGEGFSDRACGKTPVSVPRVQSQRLRHR